MTLPITAPVRAKFGLQRTCTAPFTGSYQTVGAAMDSIPNILILDNQSTVAVTISFDGTRDWKTFAPGQALVVDFASDSLLVEQATQVYLKGTGGTGTFYLSIVYAG